MSSNKSVKHSIEFSDRSRVTVGVYCAVYWLIAAIPAIIVDGVRRGFHYSTILKPQRLARCIIRATIPKSTMLSICKCSWNSLVRTFKSFCFFCLIEVVSFWLLRQRTLLMVDVLSLGKWSWFEPWPSDDLGLVL